ncbi:SDR family NAD(P)-dependent oxidoreductase, partial [Salmonella enterica subsp. enterica serovar Muenster]|nr:SDR family NAD(P)-dependent oxidoreductase [Salmonella enterica subsp. enterica serovar Muenster]
LVSSELAPKKAWTAVAMKTATHELSDVVQPGAALYGLENHLHVAQVCQRVLQKTPRLDVLVNAAGILRMGATDALSVDDWQQTF